jgi:hypothetical protein
MIEKVCNYIDEMKSPRKVIVYFLLFWLILNIIQAAFTELAHDEAYYWLFSRKLDWGYFDHPPMIALLIKIGYSLFPNEFGVRMLPLLMGTGTIYLMYLLFEKEISSISTFILVLGSVIILQSHVGSFLAIPDVPVIFFTALFFFLYKKYVLNNRVFYALLLGLVGAAMLYSKYHGVLVLLFTLSSNISLFKRKSFYAIPIIIALAMIPHLLWQIGHGFPTFEYHLVSRSSPYTVINTLNYIFSQILIAGPFIGIILFVHAIKYKTQGDYFLRAMKFNFYGFFVFFFLMSFKGHVEAHWTAIGYIPAVILSVNGINKSQKALKWLRKLFIPTSVIFLLIRMSLIFEIIPPKFNIGVEFHNWDKWAQEIEKEADGRVVVFYSTFQRPAKYSFYTGGKFAHSFNHIWYRQNQFDLWNYTDSIQGKDVILFRTDNAADTIFTATSENYGYRKIDNFVSYNNIPVIVEEKELTCNAQDTVHISVKVINNRADTIFFTEDIDVSPRFYMMYYNGKRFIDGDYIQSENYTIVPNDTLNCNLSFVTPADKGHYLAYLCIVNNHLRPGFNGKPFKLKVR